MTSYYPERKPIMNVTLNENKANLAYQLEDEEIKSNDDAHYFIHNSPPQYAPHHNMNFSTPNSPMYYDHNMSPLSEQLKNIF